MVVRGTNGCALPPEDAERTIRVFPHAPQPEHQNARVYLSGKALKNTIPDDPNNPYQLNSSGVGEFVIKWHTALEGETIQGVLTVIKSIDHTGTFTEDHHTHAYFTLTKDYTSPTPPNVEVVLGPMIP
jgi:hypothetical protein